MIQQDYGRYTASEHDVWNIIFGRQLSIIKDVAYAGFASGLQQLQFDPNMIPDFNEINARLKSLTGWSVYAVPGLIDNSYFFEQLKDKRFGSTTWIRSKEQLDYLEEPDMFHDVFGHIPLLTDPDICTFLDVLAEAASRFPDEESIERIARLYWFTIEFGLVMENGKLKIYGAGILSSPGESAFCLSEHATRVPFNLKQILDTPYIKDEFQRQYFVIEGMDELKEVKVELDGILMNIQRKKYN